MKFFSLPLLHITRKCAGILFAAGIFTTSLSADTKSDLANTYAKSINAILFFTSEDVISSGHYSFDNSDTTLDTHFIPFTHQFKSDSPFYNFYANGSIGYSKFKEGLSPTDTLEITTYAAKIGGGIRLKVAKDTHLMLGTAYLYSRTDSSFDTDMVLTDEEKRILNGTRTHHTYELSSSIGYHPTYQGYHPYATAGIRYFKTDVDSPYATISETSSTIVKLKAGVITPALTTLYGLPFKMEFYTSAVLLSGDMVDVLEFDHFFVAGATAHLETNSTISWLEEVTFDVNVVKGENFDGFNFGFGVSF